MSEYTTEEILKLIEENGGPEGLDLSGKDLSGLDLSGVSTHQESARLVGSDSKESATWIGREAEGSKGIHGINLAGSKLIGTNLQGVNLFGADMQEANLTDADLGGSNLMLARLQEVNLERANLRRARLTGASLRGARLIEADFQDASLNRVDLRDVDPLWANLQGARLTYAHLENADFLPVKSLEGACFYNAFLDDTRMRREQLGGAIGEELEGEYGLAKEAYLGLKNNFAETGRYRDESWAYVKERQMGKMCSAPWRARRFYGRSQLQDVWTWDEEEQASRWESGPPSWDPRVIWFYARHTLKWLADWFVELLCGYGESLWRVLAWMLLVIVGFAAYYQVSHAVVTSSQDAATSLWDHLIFSLGAFTTLQPARLQAARPGVELLTTIQAIIGISLAGLLGFVAGNRIRRS